MAGKLTVLADTSGIIALLDKSDRHYIWNHSPQTTIFRLFDILNTNILTPDRKISITRPSANCDTTADIGIQPI